MNTTNNDDDNDNNDEQRQRASELAFWGNVLVASACAQAKNKQHISKFGGCKRQDSLS